VTSARPGHDKPHVPRLDPLRDTRQGTLRDQRARLIAGQWHIRWIFRQDYGNPFLAGWTAAERSTRRTKKAEIAKRRRQVRELHRLGAPTSVIADLVGRDPSLIRGDLRALMQARPAV